MAMSNKDFIALADLIRQRNWNGNLNCFDPWVIGQLADFCASQNPRFKRDRWLAYIAGECGANGGKIKAA